MIEKSLEILAAIVLAGAAVTTGWASTQVPQTDKQTVNFLKGSAVLWSAGSMFYIFQATQERND